MADDSNDWQTRAGIQIDEELLFETELTEKEQDNNAKEARYAAT